MAIDEVRLPPEIEVGAQGGPGFKTSIIELWSGHERRNVDWQRERGRWDIGYGARDLSDIQEIAAFFRARQGRARGFRFKDWTDFEAVGTNIGVATAGQTQFQLRKQYVSGLVTYNRVVYRPVDGTITMYIDAVEEPDWTVDLTTGVVTFAVGLSAGQIVTADFEFDIPVRFDVDQLNITASLIDPDGSIASAPNIPIVELRQ